MIETPIELHRDFGRMEGRLDAMDDRLSKIEIVVERIDERLARIESRESQLRGVWWALALAGSCLSAAAALVLQHWWK